MTLIPDPPAGVTLNNLCPDLDETGCYPMRGVVDGPLAAALAAVERSPDGAELRRVVRVAAEAEQAQRDAAAKLETLRGERQDLLMTGGPAPDLGKQKKAVDLAVEKAADALATATKRAADAGHTRDVARANVAGIAKAAALGAVTALRQQIQARSAAIALWQTEAAEPFRAEAERARRLARHQAIAEQLAHERRLADRAIQTLAHLAETLTPTIGPVIDQWARSELEPAAA